MVECARSVEVDGQFPDRITWTYLATASDRSILVGDGVEVSTAMYSRDSVASMEAD